MPSPPAPTARSSTSRTRTATASASSSSSTQETAAKRRPALTTSAGPFVAFPVLFSVTRSDGQSGPDHPDLPARVSVLRLPARGTVARLLAPRDASAVFARFGASGASNLRPDSGAGERRRSVIPSRPPLPGILRPEATPGHCTGIARRYHSGLPRRPPAMTATLPFTGNEIGRRAPLRGPARAADRLRARPAGDRPEGLLRAVGAAHPARPPRRQEDRRDRSGRARPRLPRAPGDPPLPRLDGRQGRRRCAPRSPSATTTTPRGSGARRRTAATSSDGCSTCPASAR